MALAKGERRMDLLELLAGQLRAKIGASTLPCSRYVALLVALYAKIAPEQPEQPEPVRSTGDGGGGGNTRASTTPGVLRKHC